MFHMCFINLLWFNKYCRVFLWFDIFSDTVFSVFEKKRILIIISPPQVTHVAQSHARTRGSAWHSEQTIMSVTAHGRAFKGKTAQRVSTGAHQHIRCILESGCVCFTHCLSCVLQPSSSHGSKWPWSHRPTLSTTFSPTSRASGTSSTTSRFSAMPSWAMCWHVSLALAPKAEIRWIVNVFSAL